MFAGRQGPDEQSAVGSDGKDVAQCDRRGDDAQPVGRQGSGHGLAESEAYRPSSGTGRQCRQKRPAARCCANP